MPFHLLVALWAAHEFLIELKIPTSFEASPELRGVVDRGPFLTDVWLGSRE